MSTATSLPLADNTVLFTDVTSPLLRRGRGYRNLNYLLLKAQRLAAAKTQLVAFHKAA